MPTYDYECESCGHVFEKFHAVTSRAISKCPRCKKKARRLIGGGCGLIFKGSGFYITDYKKKENKCSQCTPSCQTQNTAKDTKESKDTSKPQHSQPSSGA